MVRRVLVVWLAAAAVATGALAQRPLGRPGGARPRVSGGAGAKGGGLKNENQRRALLDRWHQMTPEERQKALAKLPPERRKKIEEQLDRYSKLTPEEQQQLRRRYNQFNQLPLEKQDQARRLFRQFNEFPDNRRPVLRQEFNSLRNLPESDRNTRLSSEEFRQQYSPEEQKFLRELSDVVTPVQ